jgi:dolichol-phosphate mannosyltransferase
MILAHSDRPLFVSIGLGLTMALVSLAFGVYVLLRALLSDFSVQGWASLMVAIFFTAGVILTVLGIIGVYIGKIFIELKQRPLYVVSETVGPLRSTET